MKKQYFIFIFTLFFFSVMSVNSYIFGKDNFIQIKGSDTMVNLSQVWAEAFNNMHPEVNIAVTGGGSGTGIVALINHTTDIAQCSRAMDEKELKKATLNGVVPNEVIVALDAIVVVVSQKNPLNNLTMNQLRDIFMGKIKNWKELGGVDKKIVLLSREINSGTHMFFKEHVLRQGNSKGPEEFSPRALLMPSSQAIVDEISYNENAIGYYGLGYLNPTQKVIAIAKTIDSDFIKPSIDNIKNNSYPISRPLYIYTDGKPQGIVKKFIDFIYSEEGQQLVVDTDFVPLK